MKDGFVEQVGTAILAALMAVLIVVATTSR
jgi:hypothetical protein